jgi:hypothetical protein
MTQDEIILIADASGLSYYGMGKDRDKFVHYLAAFAKLVAEAEREACAKVCDELSDVNYVEKRLIAYYHAYLIRQRGQA